MAYNVFYTSVPVLVNVLDKDLSEKSVMRHPQILFYCQAGRLESVFLLQIVLYCFCILKSRVNSRSQFFFFRILPFGILTNQVKLETDYLILVHLLDGLGELSFM